MNPGLGTVFENYPKSLIFASEASYVNFQKKTFGYAFLPLMNSFEFLQILVILQYEKNHQQFKRIFKGQKCITKGFQKLSTRKRQKRRIFFDGFSNTVPQFHQ